MELYRGGMWGVWGAKFRARVVKWVFRRLWVKGPYPRYWVLPGDAIGREILTHGLFEKPVLLALRKLLCARGGILLDVGANLGNHAIFLAPLFKQVVAFEPNPAVFPILSANVALNGLKNVALVNKGLGARAAKLPFYENTPGNLGASGFVKGKDSRAVGALEIAVGDAELARLGIKPRAVSVVKIDVEGLEAEVIAGLKETLGTAQPLVLFEVLDGAHGVKIVAALGRLGYGRFYELAQRQTWRGESCALLPVARLENRYYELVVASATVIQ